IAPGAPLAIGPISQDLPGATMDSESGFYNEITFPAASSGGNLRAAGVSDYGTRLRILFKGVPPGVSLAVPPILNNTGTNKIVWAELRDLATNRPRPPDCRLCQS